MLKTIISISAALTLSSSGNENVMLTGVPDYTWYAGCFGTAGGNMMGYWDRHGFPNVYTGPTANGVAPLNSHGTNRGIRSLWASKAGFDGRPANQPGHLDNYWEFFILNGDQEIYSYESAAIDPYILAGRPEHEPDCIGDFIGASQNKYTNLDGECDGNIDAFAFNFWEKSGDRRINFQPPFLQGEVIREIQSGLRAFARSRGMEANVFSQLVDFNPQVPFGKGFTFADLKAEIDAGYPVMLFLQDPNELNRPVPGMPRANPRVHAMLAYGYVTTFTGQKYVRYKTSWGSGPDVFSEWRATKWQAELPLRGVIGLRPLPRITSVTREKETIRLQWEGPMAVLLDDLSGETYPAHWYAVEQSTQVDGTYKPVTRPAAELQAMVSSPGARELFFRIRLLTREEAETF